MSPLISAADLDRYRELLFTVKIDEKIVQYVTSLHAESQTHPSLLAGLSARAGLHVLTAARASAAVSGRDFVTPDDVRGISFAVLAHRLFLKPDAEFEGLTKKNLLDQIFDRVPVPK